MFLNLFSHCLSPELLTQLSYLVFSPFTQLSSNNDSITAFGSLLLSTNLRTKFSVPVFRMVSDKPDCLVFSLSAFTVGFISSYKALLFKVLYISHWHVFMVHPLNKCGFYFIFLKWSLWRVLIVTPLQSLPLTLPIASSLLRTITLSGFHTRLVICQEKVPFQF